MSHLFISHASEDKADFVRPLAHALKAQGLKLWYDEFSLRPGDSLRRSIDKGLAECVAGLLVLSPHFFRKEWPQRELDGLFAVELAGQAKLLPIWFQVDYAFVASRSPLLADRFALMAERGIEEVAAQISSLFPPPPRISNIELANRLRQFIDFGVFVGESIHAGCQHRFLLINAFKELYQEASREITSSYSAEQLDAWPDELDTRLRETQEDLRQRYRIPADVYLTIDEPVRDEDLAWWNQALASWTSGTMSKEESASFVAHLDLEELDEYFILVDVPNFLLSPQQRPLMKQALVELGCGFTDGYVEVEKICARLRA